MRRSVPGARQGSSVAFGVVVVMLLGLTQAPADAQSFAQSGPICSAVGTDDPAEGGLLDVSAYAAGEVCRTDRVAFTFTTHEAFEVSDFFEMYVRIDTDGNANNGCEGGDFLAYGVNRQDDEGDGVLAGVFASPDCDNLSTVGLAVVSRTGPDNLILEFEQDLIGNPARILHHGSLSNPGEEEGTADRVPDEGRLQFDLADLVVPGGVATCIPDDLDDVVRRGDSGDVPVSAPSIDLSRACLRYADGLQLDLEIPDLDFNSAGVGSGPAGVIDMDADGQADRVIRADWDGQAFTAVLTTVDGTIVCEGRVEVVRTTMRVGGFESGCIDSVDSVAFAVGMGAQGVNGSLVDRAGDGAYVPVRRLQPVDSTNTGFSPMMFSPPDPAARPVVGGLVRLAGPARIETSIAVSRNAWPEGAAAAVLARQDVEADALAGAALAAAVDGPLILSAVEGITEAASIELRRVLDDGARVYVLGGQAALPDSIVAEVQQLGFGVVRLAGESRIETGQAIADAAAGFLPEVAHILIADAFSFQAALIAGPAAGASNGVVLTTSEAGLSPAAQAFVDAHPGAELSAVGPAAASAAPSARRLVGQDDYETSVLVANAFFPGSTRAAVASGESFPDGLGGGAYAGSLGMPLLLTARDTLPSAVGDHVAGSELQELYLMGGSAAISSPVAEALESRLTR